MSPAKFALVAFAMVCLAALLAGCQTDYTDVKGQELHLHDSGMSQGQSTDITIEVIPPGAK